MLSVRYFLSTNLYYYTNNNNKEEPLCDCSFVQRKKLIKIGILKEISSKPKCISCIL